MKRNLSSFYHTVLTQEKKKKITQEKIKNLPNKEEDKIE